MSETAVKASNNRLSAFLHPDRVKLAWSVVFGLISALIAFAALVILRATALHSDKAIPDFLFSTHFGYCFLYVLSSLFVLLVVAFAFPKCFEFRGLRNNRWYYLTRMGYSTVKLISMRLAAKSLFILLAYFVGAGAGLALCSIIKLPFYINGTLVMLLFGLVCTLLMVFCLMAAGAKSSSRVAIPIFSLLCAAVLGAYMYLNGLFSQTNRHDLAAATLKLMSLDGFAFLLIAGILFVMFTVIIFLSARDKAAFVTTGLPKRTLLERMGVAKDDIVAIAGKKERTLAAGGVVNKKEQRKQDTLMISLGEVQKQTPPPKRTETKPVPEVTAVAAKRTDAIEKDDSVPNKRSFGRRLLTAVLVVLCLVSYCCAAVCLVARGAVEGQPKKILGFYAVYVADSETFEGLTTGDIALFKSVSTQLAAGRVALYKTAGATRYGTVTSVEADGSYTVKAPAGLADVQPANLLAANFSIAGFSKLPSGNSAAVAASAAVLLTGLLLLSIVVKSSKKEF